MKQLRVLVLSRNYPNNVMELLGLWVQGLVRETARTCAVKVISPVPYCPPLPYMPEDYSRFRGVPRRRWDGTVEVLHPRFVVGPGYSTHEIEWLLYEAAIRRTVAGIRREFEFDVIHAHFTYPDGVVAARLGRRYGVPVIITEQNPWGPWMDKYSAVRRKAIWAARESSALIAISSAVRTTVERYVGDLPQLTVIPDGVDGSAFTLAANGSTRPDQILFVGAIRPVKGVDILLQALRILVERGRSLRLMLIGEAFYSAYRNEESRLQTMVSALGLSGHVDFAGKQPEADLVRAMQQSALLVLPSRAESLGMVLVEALACGTPVVATRCGGPEDIVNERVGTLVEPENPEALANGIERVLNARLQYRPADLRAYALEKFGVESVVRRLIDVYESVCTISRPAAAAVG